MFKLSCILLLTVVSPMALGFVLQRPTVLHANPVAFTAKRVDFHNVMNMVEKTPMAEEELVPPRDMKEFTDYVQRAYKDDKGFQSLFNDTVAGVQEPPTGTKPEVYKNWSGATIVTLTDFFNEWYDWKPDYESQSGLNYIEKFAWLYYKNPDGVKFVQEGIGRLMTEYFVKINGKWYDDPVSRGLVEKWLKALDPKIMDQYKVPPGGYKTYNEFFTRELKDGMRPVEKEDDPSVVVSPADAVINMIDDSVDIDRPLDVKTQKITPRNLLENSKYAEKFTKGTALSCILMPDVYHRYHSPVDGHVVESNQDVAGAYFGIDNFPKLINGGNVGYGYDYSVFEHFRRGYLIIKTKDYGYVAMIPVGLNTISSVIFKPDFKYVTDKDEPVPIAKGQEVGLFQYGGSLNILLFQKGVFPSVRIPQGGGIGTLLPPDEPPEQFIF